MYTARTFRILTNLHIMQLVLGGRTVYIEGTPNYPQEVDITGFRENVPWNVARQSCSSRGYDAIAFSHIWGDQARFIRHRLLALGWPPEEDIWLSCIKPDDTSSWTDYTSCLSYDMIGVIDGNTYPQCLLLSMASDEMLVSWYGADCSEQHSYVCVKETGPLQYETFYNVTSSFSPATVQIQQETVPDEQSCLIQMQHQVNKPITIFSYTDNVCHMAWDFPQNSPMSITLTSSKQHRNIAFVSDKEITVTIDYTSSVNVHDDGVYPCNYETTELSGDTTTTFSDQTSTTAPTTTSSSVVMTYSIPTPADGSPLGDGSTSESFSELSGDTTTTSSDQTSTTVPTTSSSSVGMTYSISTPADGSPIGDGSTSESFSGTTSDISTMSTVTRETATTQQSVCICTSCSQINYTQTELNEKISHLRKTLEIDKKTLNAHARRLVSQPDDRVSSTSIGYIGVSVICVVASFLVIGDIVSVIRFIIK